MGPSKPLSADEIVKANAKKRANGAQLGGPAKIGRLDAATMAALGRRGPGSVPGQSAQGTSPSSGRGRGHVQSQGIGPSSGQGRGQSAGQAGAQLAGVHVLTPCSLAIGQIRRAEVMPGIAGSMMTRVGSDLQHYLCCASQQAGTACAVPACTIVQSYCNHSLQFSSPGSS